MRFHVITLLPGAVMAYADASILGRASRQKKIAVRAYDLRTWGKGIHRKVDDRPFGGGPGMVVQVEPVYEAVEHAKSNIRKRKGKTKTRVVLFSTRGKIFTQEEAKRLSKYTDLILICGRYEGVDERVATHIADEELSLGQFVLTGGEIPAMAVIDAVSRHIPGVLGKEESREEINGSYPAYTRPELFFPKRKGAKKKTAWAVPKELLSGDPARIEAWRKNVE